ncbi:hypothetical protein GGS23DRAFT_597956 [Durotheca rogersii]|uniref:uncharacterized protein n=1 Tax=Durotheca rogersii TaxID=419775 RepID=UPI00221E79B2|nr:uncharacterized protein GGS23DRAFT_597956 [Durotheca rogersii]KAI5861935.1 hypothetical protein GGS23DRAFT_597956 [Durotheca rogersii]
MRSLLLTLYAAGLVAGLPLGARDASRVDARAFPVLKLPNVPEPDPKFDARAFPILKLPEAAPEIAPTIEDRAFPVLSLADVAELDLATRNDGIVSAPALYQIPDGGGGFVLFYGSHCCSSDDCDAEYAFSPTIDGPYADNRGIFGPGGLDIDPSGRSAPNRGAGKRQLYSAVLTINGRLIEF